MESKENNSISAVDEVQEILGNNSLEDVTWLCSLSESELVSTFKPSLCTSF